MYNKVEKWLDEVFAKTSEENITAVAFNLYEDEPNTEWSMEVVGTGSFDMEDDDWACDEVTDFGTRDVPFSWKENADWSEIFSKMSAVVSEYLQKGKYAGKLKSYNGIAIGFVDGDLEILYFKGE